MLPIGPEPRPRPGYVHVSVAGSAGERVRQSLRGCGSAARRNRPGSSRYHVRRSAEDDQPQLLLCSAVSQNTDGVSAQPQTRGSCFLFLSNHLDPIGGNYAASSTSTSVNHKQMRTYYMSTIYKLFQVGNIWTGWTRRTGFTCQTGF